MIGFGGNKARGRGAAPGEIGGNAVDFIDPDLLYSAGAFVAATVLLTLYTRRKMRARWCGVVEEVKPYRRDRNSGDRDTAAVYEDMVRVRYHTDAGRRGSLTLKKAQFTALFGELRSGDAIAKEPGAYYPRKIAAE